MILQFLKLARIGVGFSVVTTALALSNLTVNTDAATKGFANNRKFKTYTISPTETPAIVVIRGEVSRIRNLQYSIKGAGGFINFSEEHLLSAGAATLDKENVKIDATIIIQADNGWIVDAQGRSRQAGKWEFHNPEQNKSVVATLTLGLWDDNESTAQIHRLTVSKEALILSKDERVSLNHGRCPAGLLQKIRTAAESRASIPAPAPSTVETSPSQTLSPFDRLRGINESLTAKIDAASEKRLASMRTTTVAELAALRDTFTKQEKLEEAVAVKNLGENPESEELRAKAPAEVKPIIARYDMVRASIGDDRKTALEDLRKKLLTALDVEMKAAIKRGDLDSALALKKVIGANGDFAPPPPPPVQEPPLENSPTTPAPTVSPTPVPEEKKTSNPNNRDTPFGRHVDAATN